MMKVICICSPRCGVYLRCVLVPGVDMTNVNPPFKSKSREKFHSFSVCSQDHTLIPMQSIIFMTTLDSLVLSHPNPKVLYLLVSLVRLHGHGCKSKQKTTQSIVSDCVRLF